MGGGISSYMNQFMSSQVGSSTTHPLSSVKRFQLLLSKLLRKGNLKFRLPDVQPQSTTMWTPTALMTTNSEGFLCRRVSGDNSIVYLEASVKRPARRQRNSVGDWVIHVFAFGNI